jgi:hypothetical protein
MSLPILRQVAREASRTPGLVLWVVAVAALSVASPATAQYTGHATTDQQKKAKVEPRAVSVLEWIGEPGKPVASRIVPVTVFVNGAYQDGGLYLAQPVPLPVQTDTLYELEQAGAPKGMFYVAGGQDVGGAWFGYGQWKPLGTPKPAKKLPKSKVPPRVVEDHDPDRPQFKSGNGGGDGGGDGGGETKSTGSASGSASPPPYTPPSSGSDPDKPTLHRRDSGDTAGGTDAGASSSPDANDPDKPTLHRRDATVSDSGAGTAPDDPDRPHMKKRTETTAAAGTSLAGSPVSSVDAADPDRPKLSRGQPVAAEQALDMSKLDGAPANLQQMTAISDPAVREEHVFTYPWPDPDEATRMQAAVEALAVKTVLADGAPPSSAAAPAKHATAGPRNGGSKSTLAKQVRPKVLPVVLQDKVFRAYELTYNAGATLVFTAKALVGPNNAGVTLEKYVAIIAQPDFNGDPQIRLQSVTDDKHLDLTPRMRLVDAVDARGDNQADLLFELRRSTDRQFAIYHLRGSHAEQAFATDALPIGQPNHSVADSN